MIFLTLQLKKFDARCTFPNSTKLVLGFINNVFIADRLVKHRRMFISERERHTHKKRLFCLFHSQNRHCVKHNVPILLFCEIRLLKLLELMFTCLYCVLLEICRCKTLKQKKISIFFNRICLRKRWENQTNLFSVLLYAIHKVKYWIHLEKDVQQTAKCF